jgi:hypothetical protein
MGERAAAAKNSGKFWRRGGLAQAKTRKDGEGGAD